MPKAYEIMRDKFKSQGLSDKAAKTRAAKIYNSTHKSNPVTGKHKVTAKKKSFSGSVFHTY